MRPFAVTSFVNPENEEHLPEGDGRQGRAQLRLLRAPLASFYRSFPKLLWGYQPALEMQARAFSSYVCQKVVNRPVTFSGNNGDKGKKRVLGFLHTSSTAYASITAFVKLVKPQIEACGGVFKADHTYPSVGYNVSPNSSENQIAAQNMADFQQQGVTTIIWPQGYESEHTYAGQRIGYLPEWVVAGGDGRFDGFNASENPDAWNGHAWVVSPVERIPAPRETACYRAVFEADPTADDRDIAHANTCGTFTYQNIRQLFTGIQIAGRRLNPDTVDQGFHAIPPKVSSDPTLPSCYYEPGDYTCVKDEVAEWWDSSATHQGVAGSGNGTSAGCWRMPRQGKRYLPGAWPENDVLTGKDSRSDPCNNFAGSTWLTPRRLAPTNVSRRGRSGSPPAARWCAPHG